MSVVCFSLLSTIVDGFQSPVSPVNVKTKAKPLEAANIRVSLDQPLISDSFFTKATQSQSTNLRTILGIVGTTGVRTAVSALAVGLLLAVLIRGNLTETLQQFWKSMAGRWQRLMEQLQPALPQGVPMPFDNEETEGWGVCTVKSKTRLGKTSFMQYTLGLPESNFVLPLELGQEISLMCLNDAGDVSQGNFFPYVPETKLGEFSVLLPLGTSEENRYNLGKDGAQLLSTLDGLRVGDEIALQPGPQKLTYRGQYLPVTDMVYVACGNGIVPVLEQVRTVLPPDSSSVTSVSVIWINDNARDFDVIAEVLEKEYYKYSKKLGVSCIIEDLRPKSASFRQSDEVNQSIPSFVPGTMAVVAGPTDLTSKASAYLEDRGYPRDVICVL